MPSIVLGKARFEGHTNTLSLDVDLLIQQRLLIQGNSGAGKSHLIRRLAEQLFPLVQVIIIDPEGEFATLREEFGYVLVGKGGETPADTRSAALVAKKLLELRASAVCDIYEMKARDRHEWVRLFVDALVNSPKNLWHPVVVIVDEAHIFMPEKGQGESVASGAMIDLATRGRKRGFALVAATQRLSKLSKNGTAELLNRLIGQTFEDLDLDRAADALSIPRSERDAFRKQMKVTERGNFYALGRAICTERTLVHIGSVRTSAPEPGKTQAAPPPLPSKVKASLPNLTDLPKEAEEEARTEADLRREIRNLNEQLLHMSHRVVDDTQLMETLADIERAAEEGARIAKEHARQDIAAATARAETLGNVLEPLRLALRKRNTIPSSFDLRSDGGETLRVHTKVNAPDGFIKAGRYKAEITKTAIVTSNGVTRPQQRLLNALAWWELVGVTQPTKIQVAAVAKTKIHGAFNNNCGRLRSEGFIEYPMEGHASLTEAGRKISQYATQAPSLQSLHDSVCEIVTNPQAKMLRKIIDTYPQAVSVGDLAEACETKIHGAFNNNRGRLRSMGFITYPKEGFVRAADILFPEGLR